MTHSRHVELKLDQLRVEIDASSKRLLDMLIEKTYEEILNDLIDERNELAEELARLRGTGEWKLWPIIVLLFYISIHIIGNCWYSSQNDYFLS